MFGRAFWIAFFLPLAALTLGMREAMESAPNAVRGFSLPELLARGEIPANGGQWSTAIVSSIPVVLFCFAFGFGVSAATRAVREIFSKQPKLPPELISGNGPEQVQPKAPRRKMVVAGVVTASIVAAGAILYLANVKEYLDCNGNLATYTEYSFIDYVEREDRGTQWAIARLERNTFGEVRGSPESSVAALLRSCVNNSACRFSRSPGGISVNLSVVLLRQQASFEYNSISGRYSTYTTHAVSEEVSVRNEERGACRIVRTPF